MLDFNFFIWSYCGAIITGSIWCYAQSEIMFLPSNIFYEPAKGITHPNPQTSLCCYKPFSLLLEEQSSPSRL